MEVNKVYQGDCMLLLDELEENSVDCIITDPPYSTPVIPHCYRNRQAENNFPLLNEYKII